MPTSTRTTRVKTTATAGSTDSSAAGKKPRAKGVSGADAEVLEVTSVSVTDVPRAARASKNRNNPYDALLTVSYEENDEKNDKYRAVKTSTEKADAQVRLIRSAATFLEIGSRILNPQDNGDGTTTIWFRAQSLRKRGPRKVKTEASE